MTERRYLTLPELIVKMVREGKTDTPEFHSLITYYGRDRLRELYALHLGIKKEAPAECTSSSTQIIAPLSNAQKPS